MMAGEKKCVPATGSCYVESIGARLKVPLEQDRHGACSTMLEWQTMRDTRWKGQECSSRHPSCFLSCDEYFSLPSTDKYIRIEAVGRLLHHTQGLNVLLRLNQPPSTNLRL